MLKEVMIHLLFIPSNKIKKKRRKYMELFDCGTFPIGVCVCCRQKLLIKIEPVGTSISL